MIARHGLKSSCNNVTMANVRYASMVMALIGKLCTAKSNPFRNIILLITAMIHEAKYS